MPDLNSLLDDESMGGGSVGGHGLVLALHLLRELQSFNTFTSMLTKQYSLLCDGINCLEPFHRTLQNEVRVWGGEDCGCVDGWLRVSIDVCWCGGMWKVGTNVCGVGVEGGGYGCVLVGRVWECRTCMLVYVVHVRTEDL